MTAPAATTDDAPRIDHVAIRVHDLDEVVGALTAVLGFDIVTPVQDGASPRVCYLRLQGFDVELVEDPSGPTRLDHLALGVASLDDARAALAGRGVDTSGAVLAGGRGSRNVWLPSAALGGVRVHLCERDRSADGPAVSGPVTASEGSVA